MYSVQKVYTVEEFLNAQVSPATRRIYHFGLKTFHKWYKKPAEEFLKERAPEKTLELYWVWLKKTYRGNTPRCKICAIMQYCHYNDIYPRVRKGLHISKQEESIRDHWLELEEVRKMYKVGDVADQVLVKCWLFGIRNKDARHLEWRDFDFGGEPSEKLKRVVIRTQKEGIPAQLFIDGEFQRLLKDYLPTLDKKNPYLLQSNKGGKVSEKQLLRRIKTLAKKARIRIRENQVFGWHNARYLRSRMAEELNINKTVHQKMVGQATGVAGRYSKHSDITKPAEKLLKALRMEPEKESKTHPDIEAILEEVGMVQAKMIMERVREPLKERGMLGLQTKEETQELDPIKDWRKIIKNYLVFDEATLNPPTPNRDRRKKREVVKEA